MRFNLHYYEHGRWNESAFNPFATKKGAAKWADCILATKIRIVKLKPRKKGKVSK